MPELTSSDGSVLATGDDVSFAGERRAEILWLAHGIGHVDVDQVRPDVSASPWPSAALPRVEVCLGPV
jgi:hypothetical protein